MAGAVARLVTSAVHELPSLLDGLPGNGSTVFEFNELIASAENVSVRPVAVPMNILASEFPEFLDYEPLWREEALSVSKANLFTVTGWVPHDPKDWLVNLVRHTPLRPADNDVRAKELAFLRRHDYA